MSYTTVDAVSLKPAPGQHPAVSPYDKAIGQALGVRAFGLYQVELPPGGQTVRHDHTDDGAQDVCAFVPGSSAAWAGSCQLRRRCAANASRRSASLTWPELIGSDAATYASGRIR
jgi:hypothetical protein